MQKTISIIIPVHNEEKNIPLINAELLNVFKNLSYNHEIIYIDDGSIDSSQQVIEGLTKSDGNIKGIEFSRNFGHQAAIEAGLASSKGDAVIMMDGDLQHPPKLIPELIKKWNEGYLIVNTKRIDNENVGFFKKITSNLFYSSMNLISDIKLEPGSADFRLVDRQVVELLNTLTEKHKFYRGLINWIGFKNTLVEYDVCKRINGQSSYTLKKMLTLAREGMVSFSMLPMKFIFFIGLLLFMSGSFLMAIMVFVKYFVDFGYFSGSAMLAMFIISNNGFVIMLMGIIATYQITMSKEIQNRPNFIISKKNNL